MAIVLNEKKDLFTLQTDHTMYQMKVDDCGVLLHTYYGKKTSVCDYSYLITYADRGFRGILMKKRMTVLIPWMRCLRSILPMAAGITGPVH